MKGRDMAQFAGVADVHSVQKLDMGGYTHTRHPLKGVKVYIKLTNQEARLIERKFQADTKAAGRAFGPQWRYTRLSDKTGILSAVFKIDDNPWNLGGTTLIAQKALELAQSKLEALGNG